MPELESPDVDVPEHDHEHERRDDAIPIGLATQEVVDLLEEFARGLTAGDGDAVAELWDVPAFVIGDTMSNAIDDIDDVAEFMGGAKDQYRQRGITDTRGDIVHLQWVGERIALVEVRWPYLNAAGDEIGAESSTYTLRRDDDGHLKIRVAVMHGVEREAH